MADATADDVRPRGDNKTEVRYGYSAFISHASGDRAVADAICDQLEATGFRCWIAPRDVRPGQNYPQEIIRGIESSKCLVLVLSAGANKSTFVRAEVERAYSKGKPVFPIRVEEVLPSRALELFISTKHWIDAWQGDLSGHAARLARELARSRSRHSALRRLQKARAALALHSAGGRRGWGGGDRGAGRVPASPGAQSGRIFHAALGLFHGRHAQPR